MKLLNRFSISLASFLAVIALWWLLGRVGAVDPVFLPPPANVAKAFIGLFNTGFLLGHLVPSFFRVTAAFVLSFLIAFPVAILCSQSTWISRLVEPVFGFTRYLPVAALVPLCILWFGIDDRQKIAVITIGVVFQLTLLFVFDFLKIPHELVEAGRTFGLSRFQLVYRIVLPAAMPAVWDDMRISAGWAWSYLVLAELVAGNKGLGYFVVQSQRYLEIDNVFAGILFIGILGALTDGVFRVAALRLFRWV
jgi:NitT/TauT family transport system permease protein